MAERACDNYYRKLACDNYHRKLREEINNEKLMYKYPDWFRSQYYAMCPKFCLECIDWVNASEKRKHSIRCPKIVLPPNSHGQCPFCGYFFKDFIDLNWTHPSKCFGHPKYSKKHASVIIKRAYLSYLKRKKSAKIIQNAVVQWLYKLGRPMLRHAEKNYYQVAITQA